MQTITLQRSIAAEPSSIWAVLADFPNIADWNGGVKTSYATSDSVEGVGATRHCDLSPAGALEETVAEWEPERRLVVDIDSATKIPIKRGVATFTLDPADHGGTDFTLRYDYLANGGPLSPVVGRMMAGQLRKGFNGFIDDLEAAAEARPTT